MRTPRLAGVRADYDRILKQRNSLLKTAGAARRGSAVAGVRAVDARGVGRPPRAHRRRAARPSGCALVEELRPYVGQAYETVARGATRDDAGLDLPASSLPSSSGAAPTAPSSPSALLAELERRRNDELDRGVSLVGPHRDELLLTLGTGPASTGCRCRGYASHGESWSFALALRLASYDLVRADGDDPILILDDVFAELDTERRAQLAELVAGAEQVLVTAAVAADVPEKLAGVRFLVGGRRGDAVTTDDRAPAEPTGDAGRADRGRPDARDDGLDLARTLARADRALDARRARRRSARVDRAAAHRPGLRRPPRRPRPPDRSTPR